MDKEQTKLHEPKHIYTFEEHKPKVHYYAAKEMHPKKSIYQHQSKSIKHQYPTEYHFEKSYQPKKEFKEYELPKEYYYHQQYQDYKDLKGGSSKHTVFRGNNEEEDDEEQKASFEESDELPHDIHVNH